MIGRLRNLNTGRVVTLFGCGGDRDRAKRPRMGEIAARLSDFVIITSDNPRTEEPGKIIDDILSGMKGTATPYIVIENRREAIGWALQNAQPGDIIILAGKGHETYQIIGREKHHFDEREIVEDFLRTIVNISIEGNTDDFEVLTAFILSLGVTIAAGLILVPFLRRIKTGSQSGGRTGLAPGKQGTPTMGGSYSLPASPPHA